MLKKVAILVDGDFFIKHHKYCFKLIINKDYDPTPQNLAIALQRHCLRHIDRNKEGLYHIFFRTFEIVRY